MVITTSSSAIKSSMRISSAECTITERRSSPYFSLISINSSLMICIRIPSSAKIDFKNSMVFINSAYSSLILSRSSPVNRRSVISKIALDCKSERPNFSIKPVRASSGVSELRINLITSSK